MTVIAGLVHKDSVYIGGDSAGTAGLSIDIREDEKVFINGSFIIGITTSFRMGNLLRYKFAPPKQKDKMDDMEYMATDFIDAVIKCFETNKYKKNDEHGQQIGGSFLVGFNKKLYQIHDDFQVGLSRCKYAAVGCGADLALGSLHSSSKGKLKPKNRIKLALEAASAHSAGVAPPFVILKSK